MPKDSRSADFSDGNGRITKASGSTNITPKINWNPDLTEKHGDDVDEYGGGEMCYPANGGGLMDPVG